MRRTAFLAPIASILAFAGLQPAAAQDAGQTAAGGDRVNTIIVYGEDPCPASTGDDITVCARKPEAERYRIPAPLRETPSSRSEAWNQKVLAYETVGRTGINSCSPVGPGGSLGCTQKLIDRAYAERAQAGDVGFAKLLEEERAKRAATVDADAAATQSRVEEAERAYEARQRSTSDPASDTGATPGAGDPTVTSPAARP